MLNKKIIMLTIILVGLLTISAISATEDMNLTTSDAQDDMIVESSIEDVEVDDTDLGATDDSELSVDQDINVELENDVGEVNGYFTLNVYRSSKDAYNLGKIIYYMDDKGSYSGSNFTISSDTPQNFELKIAIGEVKMNSTHTIYVNCSDSNGNPIKNYEFPVTVNGFFMDVFTDDDAEWGGDIPIHFAMPENALGTINFTFNGKNYIVKYYDNPNFDKTGYTVIINKEDVRYGINSIIAEFTPSSNLSPFKQKTIKVNITIRSKIHFSTYDEMSSYDVDYDGNDIIWLALPSDAHGKLEVSIDSQIYMVNQDNGKFVFHYPRLELNDHELNISYIGDDYEIDYGVSDDGHTPLTKVSRNITLVPFLNISSLNLDGSKIKLSVIMPSKYNGKVTFWRDTADEKHIMLGTAEIKGGNAIASFKLASGVHKIRAHVECDGYEGESNEKTAEVSEFYINMMPMSTNNKTVNITAKSNIDYGFLIGKFLFIVQNMNITPNYAGNGIWWAEYTFNDYGEYGVNASFSGLDDVEVSVNNATISVNKFKTVLSASVVTATYNVNKNLLITLKDDNGNALSGVKIIVKIANSKTYTTDKNGQVKVNVAKLVPKTYVAKITFNGNGDYEKTSRSVKVTVKKANPKLFASKKTFKKSTKTKKYKITLKTNQNKAMKSTWVTLKVNKKTYKVKTKSKGQAVFKITNLKKKGTFKAKIKYAGSKYYNDKTVKTKIIVK